MKKFISLILCFVMLFSIICVGFSASAANQTTNYKQYSTPSNSGDYAYWNGSKVVRASGTTVDEVRWMQAALNYCIKNKGLKVSELLDVDGSFGPASKAATKKFQSSVGLTSDGSFGPDTIKKMKSVLKSTTDSTKKEESKKTTEYSLYWPVPKSAHKIGGLGPNSDFGPRNTGIKGASTNHKGIDLSVPVGTSVYAVADGTVTAVDYSNVRGYYVVIYHEDLGISTLYQHLNSTSVKKGQEVDAGKRIAYSGKTGIGSGPHLHYGVITGKATSPGRDQNYAIDPMGKKISYTYYK